MENPMLSYQMNQYSMEWLIDAFEQGSVHDYLYFESKAAANDLSDVCFSLCYPASFQINEIHFHSVEHWMKYPIPFKTHGFRL
jgi:predicted NAD-dependent protein-ADP-ribosyltransferase YbiA (DUF1768 family)